MLMLYIAKVFWATCPYIEKLLYKSQSIIRRMWVDLLRWENIKKLSSYYIIKQQYIFYIVECLINYTDRNITFSLFFSRNFLSKLASKTYKLVLCYLIPNIFLFVSYILILFFNHQSHERFSICMLTFEAIDIITQTSVSYSFTVNAHFILMHYWLFIVPSAASTEE